jgi:hypothetical protein
LSPPRAPPRRFQNRRVAGSACTLRCAPCVHPRDRDCPRQTPCGALPRTIGTPSVVSRIDRVAPAARIVQCFLVGMRCATLRTVLASERPPCASARCADSSSASVVSSSGLATPRVPPRAMRRTDFCLLTCLRTSTRASSVPGASNACAPAPRGKQSPGSHQSDSLRWAARPCFWFIAMGVLLPVVTRADRTSDIPVASSVGARPLAWCGDRRRPPRPFLARSRERYELVNDPGCLPSGKDPRPATPSRAPGSGLRWTHGLATVIPDLAASFTPGGPCGSSGGQVPVHAPRCQRETRFSGPRRRLPTSAT